jgi:hypothetical protein
MSREVRQVHDDIYEVTVSGVSSLVLNREGLEEYLAELGLPVDKILGLGGALLYPPGVLYVPNVVGAGKEIPGGRVVRREAAGILIKRYKRPWMAM